MHEQMTWTGKVEARLAQGQKTGLQLKKGDVISVVASGYVRFGTLENQWADPASAIPTHVHDGYDHKLVALIGDDETHYPIGTGVLNWIVPSDGELTFLFVDTPNWYVDNSGAFDVTVIKQKQVIVSFVN